MTTLVGIPQWFYEENDRFNIWKPPFIERARIAQEILGLEQGVDSGWKETDVQSYLKTRPYLFDGLYRHGHGTFVFSEFQLGTEYVADWVIGSGHSGGVTWDLIELECPQSIPFMNDGHFAVSTRKGIDQINDWRNWIEQNTEHVGKPKSSHGLGLFDITCRAHGIVVAGRRSLYDAQAGRSKYAEARKLKRYSEGIEIISYETLIQKMRFHIAQAKQ